MCVFMFGGKVLLPFTRKPFTSYWMCGKSCAIFITMLCWCYPCCEKCCVGGPGWRLNRRLLGFEDISIFIFQPCQSSRHNASRIPRWCRSKSALRHSGRWWMRLHRIKRAAQSFHAPPPPQGSASADATAAAYAWIKPMGTFLHPAILLHSLAVVMVSIHQSKLV